MFTAVDQTSGRQVALKVYHPEKRDPYRQGCFAREESLLREFVGQPNVIGWIAPRSSFQERLPTGLSLPYSIDFDYYALELASGDLRAVATTQTWQPAQLLQGFRDAAKGVQRLHNRRIAHRDLKPDNLLVTNLRTVSVSDLGAARKLDETISPLMLEYSFFPGDVRYAAPEMLACIHDVRPEVALAADFYALGAILFELFTGYPFGSLLLLDANYLSGLLALCSVERSKRLAIYQELLPAIADRQLPIVSDFDDSAPRAIREHLDGLVSELVRLDYRRRLTDFGGIFKRVDVLLIILRNELSYTRWRQLRERRRVVVAEKHRLRSDRRAAMSKGGT